MIASLMQSIFIARKVDSQPALNEIAAHVNLSHSTSSVYSAVGPALSPKRFLQVLTLERAKQLLSESKSCLRFRIALG